MWRELIGSRVYKAGTNGTVSLPAGAFITRIWAHSTAGGTVTIFGGDAAPVIANNNWEYQAFHDQLVARTGALDVVFTNTDSYFIEYFKSGNT